MQQRQEQLTLGWGGGAGAVSGDTSRDSSRAHKHLNCCKVLQVLLLLSLDAALMNGDIVR